MSSSNAVPRWATSTYSSNHEACVEVAVMPGAMGMRDTKNRGQGPELWVRPAVARAFLAGVVNGTLDA